MAAPCSTLAIEAPTLGERTAAPDYAARVAEIVERLAWAATPAEAVALFTETVHRMGAECGVFASFIREDEWQQSFRFLLACDPVLCEEYRRQGWYSDDPWLHYAQHHTEPIRGEQIPALTAAHQRVSTLIMSYGFRSSVVVPAPSSGGLSRLGVLVLGSSTLGYFDGPGYSALRLAARSAAMEIHEWFVRQVRDELMRDTRLTEEEIALLVRERDGESTKQIAAALGTSEISINSRFQRLNAKLNVPNRRSAARLAAEYGLI
jgi:DNA-binding CsgD family transcriptional regulator